MADLEEFEDPEHPLLPVPDTNPDDTGELDYEPSEPSANSIKDAVSDDEEEGEAGDSDHEQMHRIPSSDAAQHVTGVVEPGRLADDDDYDSSEDKKDHDEEFSGPEEGEVDELEEGEVKDESDAGSESGAESGKQKCATGDRMKPQGTRLDRPSAESKNQRDDKPPRKIAPITAPSPTSAQDGKQSGDGRPEDNGVCKFYLRGQCTWGSFCKFLHPAGDRPSTETEAPRRSIDPPTPVLTSAPVPLMALKAELPPPPPSMSITIRGSSPPSETAWERGLKQARERIKRATEKREIDPDFERKRLTMPLGVGTIDDTPSPIVIDQPSPASRAGPRPLMDFGRSGDRFVDEGPTRRLPEPRQQYGRDPHYGDFENGSRPAYERRQPPTQPTSMGRGREPTNDQYSRPQQISMQPRREESQDRYFGADRRDNAARNPQPSMHRDRQNYNRDEYQAASIGAHRSSQDLMTPQQPYQRYSTSSSTDFGGQQYQERRVGATDRDERDVQRRRLEPEQQGWEYRGSPPAYYRDRDPGYVRNQEERGNGGRRNYEDRSTRDVDIRRTSVQQPRMNDQAGQGDNRNQQGQYRPPNYHYYRTLQQQQQNRNRSRTSDQERKPGSDNNRDRDASGRTERAPAKGKNEYNYHFYNTRERQGQQQQTGRPLPYERPSYTRQDQQGQWRDPWRRSTSPGRRGSGAGGGGENRHSSQSKRTPSRDRGGTNSPSGGDGLEKRRRHASGSSSASGSSGSSRSSGDSGRSAERRRAPRLHSGAEPIGRKEPGARRGSAGSSSGGSFRNREQIRQTSVSPVDGGRDSRYDRYKKSSKERSPVRTVRKEAGDVASRAAAKALGSLHERSVSPFGDGSPRAYRRPGSDSGRRSSAGSRNSGAAAREHRHQASSPATGQSPEAGGRLPETRPLSPPPPAPFLAAAVRVSGKGSEKTKSKHGSFGQQHAEHPRQPIKMTIANKSKVRTNIYDQSDEEGDPSVPPPADNDPPEKMSPSPVDSPSTPPDEGPAPKKMKTDADSAGGDNRVVSRREELLRQLRAVEHAIDAKRKKDKK